MSRKLIYLADDNDNIRKLLHSFLVDAGYDAVVFDNGDDLMTRFLNTPCDLIILDVMMPGTDGITICERIRNLSTVPIIILTAKESEMDYIMGITMGSDDYLIKPFRPTVLMMRIKALLRRSEMEQKMENSDQNDILQCGNITMIPSEKVVQCNNEDLNLTLTEYDLLKYFMTYPKKAITREELLNKIWGYDTVVETRVTDENIRRLRKKMKNAKSNIYIQTVWGHGYKLIKEKDCESEKD